MKKYCIIFMMLLLVGTPKANAFDISTLLNGIGFNISSQKDEKAEITKVLDKQQNYANKKNYAKLKTLYSNTYANTDGIDIESYIESLKKASEIHEKLEYKTIINSIDLSGNYATVEAVDTADGITKDSYETIKGKGVVHSEAKALYYLKKEDGEWRIDSEIALTEKSYLKYGSAINIDFTMEAPQCVKANTEYNIKIKTDIPASRGIIASITTQTVQFPHQKSEEIFRTLKRDGELERVVISNNSGKNETAFASVAITNATLNKENKIDFIIDGVAFISSRVNVIGSK